MIEQLDVRSFDILFWLSSLENRRYERSFQMNALNDGIFFSGFLNGRQGIFNILVRLRHRRRKIGRHAFANHVIYHFIDFVGIAVHRVKTVAAMAMNVNKTRHDRLAEHVNNFIIRRLANIFAHPADGFDLLVKPDVTILNLL